MVVLFREGGGEPECLAAALKLLELGFVPVPADSLGKRPKVKIKGEVFQAQLRDVDFHRQHWAKSPKSGLALVLEGCLLIDPDTQEAVDAVESWMERNDISCPMQVTPGGGRHYLVALDTPLTPKVGCSDLVPSLDWKCGNTSIGMLAPTVGKDGKGYQWAEGRSIYELPLPRLTDDQVLSLREELGIGLYRREPVIAAAAGPSGLTPEGLVPVGGRHDALVELAGSLRRCNRSKDEARTFLRAFRDHHCESGSDADHALDDREIEEILDWNFDDPAPPWLYSPNQNKFVDDVTENSAEAVIMHCLINMADMRGRIENNAPTQATLRGYCNIGARPFRKALKALRKRKRVTLIKRNNNFYNKKMQKQPTSTIYIIHYEDWSPS